MGLNKTSIMSDENTQATNIIFADYIMRNAGLDEAQAGIKIGGRNINNLRYADDTTLMAESKGKARAELRPARRQARLPHSRSLPLPGRER